MVRSRALGLVGLAVLAVAALLVGCPGPSPEKSEAAGISRAVNALREADNAKKAAFLEALRDAPCSAEDICAVRSACLAAYELHVRALTDTASLAADGSAAPLSVESLEGLKRDLGRASALAGRCTDAQGAMIRRYKL